MTLAESDMPATLSSIVVSTNGKIEGRKGRRAAQRKQLPDGPGVYLFRDEKG
ncbi:MAG: hypothetical protein JWP18_872, partial [Solirubrobacterales bacterium]|nr:hypothetical protein [Solirubrobacterales bacterium]